MSALTDVVAIEEVSNFERTCKRVVDYTGAAIALLMLAPLMAVIAWLIKRDSSGPALFTQRRLGKDGQPFLIYKFRTMAMDAEASVPEQHTVLFKLANDPRVTRLGKFLRRTSLDELPQLFNVLRGEMSLVGPRPLQVRDSDKLVQLDPDGFHARLRVLPGVTGPWQVGGRSDVNHERMVELDLEYVRNWSLVADALILLKTVKVVLSRRGAY